MSPVLFFVVFIFPDLADSWLAGVEGWYGIGYMAEHHHVGSFGGGTGGLARMLSYMPVLRRRVSAIHMARG